MVANVGESYTNITIRYRVIRHTSLLTSTRLRLKFKLYIIYYGIEVVDDDKQFSFFTFKDHRMQMNAL